MKTVRIILLLTIIVTVSSLHLHMQSLHEAISPVALQAQVTTAIQNLSSLNSSLTLTIAGLNPFNQQQRISSL